MIGDDTLELLKPVTKRVIMATIVCSPFVALTNTAFDSTEPMDKIVRMEVVAADIPVQLPEEQEESLLDDRGLGVQSPAP